MDRLPQQGAKRLLGVSNFIYFLQKTQKDKINQASFLSYTPEKRYKRDTEKWEWNYRTHATEAMREDTYDKIRISGREWGNLINNLFRSYIFGIDFLQEEPKCFLF